MTQWRKYNLEELNHPDNKPCGFYWVEYRGKGLLGVKFLRDFSIIEGVGDVSFFKDYSKVRYFGPVTPPPL